MVVTATEFQQNVGKYQDAALVAPVTITKNGRNHTVLISADYFEAISKGRVSRSVADLDDATMDAIAKAEVPAEYAHLDAYLRAK
jgi:prevent-host-death family protein